MVKDKVKILKDILRILTPEEINELTKSSLSSKRTPLTDIMMESLFVGKVSSKKQMDENPDENVSDISGEPVKTVSYLCGKQSSYALSALIADIRASEKDILSFNKRKKRRAPAKQTSSFILEEKKKIEQAYRDSKTAEIIDLYDKSSKVNIEQQRKMKDDLSKSGVSGILIRKKA